MAAVSDGRFIICAYWITRMPSVVFDVHTLGVGCINQVCNMSVCCYECRDWSLFVVMSAVTGRTHLHWCYRTLKARRDSTMRC